MAERKVKCKICGKQDFKENMIQVGRRYVCSKCMEETDGVSDWDLLFETIKRIYGHDPTPMMYKQLKDYREKYNLTDGGMNATLCYMYDILEIPMRDDKGGLALLLYYYEECKEFYNAIARSEDSLENSQEVEDVVVTNMDFSARTELLKQNKKPLEFDEGENEDESEE